MKSTTRDNITYLAVALSLVALIAADVFYSLSHDRQIWMPSRFFFRAVATTSLLIYFAFREVRRLKTTLVKGFASVLFVVILHLIIVFAFRQSIDRLPGLIFSVLGVAEM